MPGREVSVFRNAPESNGTGLASITAIEQLPRFAPVVDRLADRPAIPVHEIGILGSTRMAVAAGLLTRVRTTAVRQ